jgi:conjugal transfer pilus assembly protein TraF
MTLMPFRFASPASAIFVAVLSATPIYVRAAGVRFALVQPLLARVLPLAGPADSSPADGKPTAGGRSLSRSGPVEPSGARGYWFYLLQHIRLRPPTEAIPKPGHRQTANQKNPCRSETAWTAHCGFLKPKTFAFQSKERDALLHRMVMRPGNPKAVAAFQYYIRWVVDQSIYAAQVWQYNRLRNTKLNPDAYSPISRYGLQLAAGIQTRGRGAVWAALKRWGAFLVVFTKQSCEWCHAQAFPLEAVRADTELTIYDASLQGKCLKAFSGPTPANGQPGKPAGRSRNDATSLCSPPARSMRPAQVLHVSVVPTVFLWLPKNLWIRVGAGLTTTDDIETRIYNFFVAWRTAAATGHETGHTGLDLNPRDVPPTIGALRKILSGALRAGHEASE